MAATHQAPLAGGPSAPPSAVPRPSTLAVGTVVWLSSELMFFGGLFAALFTLRGATDGPWPPDGADLDIPLATLLTVLLVASSATQHRAHNAAVHRGPQASIPWLAATLALGTIFVGGQLYEWSHLDFGVGSHPFGSVFFTLTGFHGLHVVGGLVALALVLRRSAAVHDDALTVGSIDVVTKYWHFVDVIWIAVYGCLYLL